MTVTWLWSGALSDTSCRVRAKLAGVTSAALAVETDPHLSAPTLSEAVTPDANGIAAFDAAGSPGATHYYAIEQDGIVAPGGLELDGTSGDYATTPDDPTLDITGDIDLRCDLTIPGAWTSSATDGVRSSLVAKWQASNRAYALTLENDGTLALFWSADGSASISATSTAAVGFGSGARGAVRVTLDVDNDSSGRDVTFYTAPGLSGPWTQLGSVVTQAGVTSIFSGTAEASLGALDGGTGRRLTGTIHAAEIRNGIDGPTVADPHPALHRDFGDSALTWTVQGGAVVEPRVGRFRTLPAGSGGPASFTMTVSGDAGLTPVTPGVGSVLASSRQSNHAVFDTIRQHDDDPDLFVHLGDLHYYDLGSGNHGIIGGASLANYRRAIDDVMLQPRQHDLYRTVPTIYGWDDHDYGPNNSDGTHPEKQNAADVYRQYVPSYGLPDTGAIYQAWQVGRVQFVLLDTRFYRSPNGQADGPSKTMLGSAQKAWLADLLDTSTAELLIVFSSVRWLNGSTDSWPGFATERQELADLFESTGWADRMCMIQADVHANAFDSGVNNDWGGFPVYVVGSLDATPFSPGSPYDLGTSSARDQYGTFRISDDGSQIQITARSWEGATAQLFHSWTISTVEPEPGPEPIDPERPDVAVASERTSVTWLGCDLVTGRIIAELPEIKGQVSRVLGAYTSSSLTLPIPLGGPGALGETAFEATAPGVTMIVAIVNDVPTWGGIVLSRQGGTDGTLSLGCVSLEGYLDRRFVGDHSWTEQDAASVIAAGLVGDAQVEGIDLILDSPASGVLRSRDYVATDDVSVYSALREVAADGLEWTIDLDWADDTHETVAKIWRMRGRIGTAAEQPGAIFETTAPSVFSSKGVSEARYVFSEDYTDGRGANHIIATASGEGEDRPQSNARHDVQFGWPRYERRFSPSTSVTAKAQLNSHAEAELALRRDGAQTWQVTARWDVYPQLNLDYRLGDDVGWELTGHRHPHGVVGQGRCIGYELDLQAGAVNPILWTGED